MRALLLDTDVVSFLMRNDTRAELYRTYLESSAATISFMTAAELHEGALRGGWGDRKMAGLEAILRRYPVIHSTPEICRLWGEVRAARRHRPISVSDAWIAATALACGCPLVTHNPRDFEGVPDLVIITEQAG